jgi:hypothetical protein
MSDAAQWRHVAPLGTRSGSEWVAERFGATSSRAELVSACSVGNNQLLGVAFGALG